MSVVRNAHRRELYNCEPREGWKGNLREREEGREGEGGGRYFSIACLQLP